MVSMSQHSDINTYPLLSIVIPYQDNLKEISEILISLERQSYPAERVEILLIYNGSSTGLKTIKSPTHQTFKLHLLEEKNHLNSPYSARNRGLEKANGDIIIFIDANSTPDEFWLEHGVHCLSKKKWDIMAGKVGFDFGNNLTAAKVVDSLTSINMKKAVEERGVAYTANLFVKKEVFKEQGYFEEQTRSGGDVRFTREAVQSGFTIGYCENAVVLKKARSCTQLYKKKFRTGKGYFYTWKDEEAKKVWFYNFIRSLKPPSLGKYNLTHIQVSRCAVWFHLYMVGIIEQTAFMAEYFSYNLSSRRDKDRRKELLSKNSE